MPLIDLIINACIAFTGFYLLSKGIYSDQVSYPFLKSISTGVLAGLLGFLLMLRGIEITDTVRVDLRHLPLVLLGFYGLRMPLFIATIMIASTRFAFGFNQQSLVAFIATCIIGAGMIFIHKRYKDLALIQCLLLNVWALIIITFAILLNLGWTWSTWIILSSVWGVGILAAVLSSVLSVDFDIMNNRVKEYKNSAERDHLTGLFNRRAWDSNTSKLDQDGRRYNLLVLDIDCFKHINDTYGHANGDQILKQFADCLNETIRPHDLLARVGGEEFMILIYDLPLETCQKVAERIRQRIEDERFLLINDSVIRCTVSIGLSHGQGIVIESMISSADKALYEAKNNGRNQVVVLSPLPVDDLNETM